MSGFIKGLGYNFAGFNYFLANRELWKYAIIPFFLNLIVFVSLISAYIGYFPDIMGLGARVVAGLNIADPAGVWAHILDGVYWCLRGLFQIVFFLLSLVMVFLAATLVSQIVNANFYESMSERILIKEGLLPDRAFEFKRFLGDLTHSVKIELAKFVIFAGITIALLALSLLPVIGIVFAILQLAFTAWLFAFGVASFPMVKQRQPLRDIFSWGFERKALLAGLGSPALIPFVALFTTCFHVTGATLLYRDARSISLHAA